MKDGKTSVFANGMIWFGAAVSIAEIVTGTLIAPLGFAKGLTAILLGHLIGCALMYFAGIIGAKTGKSAMETVKMSFGQKGSLIFSTLNVLQLVGWTAIMILNGAKASSLAVGFGGERLWSVAIGALIIFWVLVGLKNLGKINILAMSALFVLTVVLCFVIFGGQSPALPAGGGISFGAAVEISVAMPLSWLPLISDYTREAKKPRASAFASVAVYFLTSSWMYVIGMGAAIFTGKTDIAEIMAGAGLGIAALVIVIFSTVTTTFLDVYSAGVSSESIYAGFKEKPVAIAVSVIGTVLAMFAPVSQYENFLYLIGSVFAPMTAVLLTDYFILKKDSFAKSVNAANVAIWAAGFVVYRVFMGIETPAGNTLPVMIITSALCVLWTKVSGGGKDAKRKA
mgnify:CR=1 FL=1